MKMLFAAALLAAAPVLAQAPAPQAPAVIDTPPAIARDHEALLASPDPKLAANKRLVYDMYREVLQAGHYDRVAHYMLPTYIQHNPNVSSGAHNLVEYVKNSRPVRPIEPKLMLPLVNIVAEGDYVTLAFVRPEKDDQGREYLTTWFDMFRIENGRIAEHWDPAIRSAKMLKVDPNTSRGLVPAQ